MGQPFTFSPTSPLLLELSLDGSDALEVSWLEDGFHTPVQPIPPGPCLLYARNGGEEDRTVVVGTGDDAEAVAAWAFNRPGGAAEVTSIPVGAGETVKRALAPGHRFLGLRLPPMDVAVTLTARGLVSRGPSTVRFAETGVPFHSLGF